LPKTRKLRLANIVERGRAELLIPNYLNSQNMCLSTSSMFTVCCVNECDGLLAGLENTVNAPEAPAEQIKHWARSASSSHAHRSHALNTNVDGSVRLHSKDMAEWMHLTFPLECPKPIEDGLHGAAHPKTPNEWIGESDPVEVKDLEDTIIEVSEVLSKYTTMGKELGQKATKPKDTTNSTAEWLQSQQNGSNSKADIVPIRAGDAEASSPSRDKSVFPGVFRLIPIIPMSWLVWVAAQRLFHGWCFVACIHDIKAYKGDEHIV